MAVLPVPIDGVHDNAGEAPRRERAAGLDRATPGPSDRQMDLEG